MQTIKLSNLHVLHRQWYQAGFSIFFQAKTKQNKTKQNTIKTTKTQNKKQQNKTKQNKEWVNNWWWGWQNRTNLEKCTYLYDDIQGKIKHKINFLCIFLHRTKTLCRKRLCLTVPCMSSYRWVHFSRAVLLKQSKSNKQTTTTTATNKETNKQTTTPFPLKSE